MAAAQKWAEFPSSGRGSDEKPANLETNRAGRAGLNAAVTNGPRPLCIRKTFGKVHAAFPPNLPRLMDVLCLLFKIL